MSIKVDKFELKHVEDLGFRNNEMALGAKGGGGRSQGRAEWNQADGLCCCYCRFVVSGFPWWRCVFSYCFS